MKLPGVMARLVVSLALAAVCAGPLEAGQHHALVVTGASGDAKFAEQYDQWRERLTTALATRMAFGRDRVIALGEKPVDGVGLASRDNVREALTRLAGRLGKADVLLVVLIGHGTFDGEVAKFNLVGPDLDAADWAALLKPIKGQVIVVNTTSASFPFLPALAASGRVVVTATDSRASRYDTVFPEYFVKALESDGSDADRDGRLSIWEAFSATTAGVRRYYEEKGLLAVEHARLDDAGDGIGKDAEQPGTDTSVARGVFLTAASSDGDVDAEARELMARRDQLLDDLRTLKSRKASADQASYQAALERLLVDLAKVSRALRAKGRT